MHKESAVRILEEERVAAVRVEYVIHRVIDAVFIDVLLLYRDLLPCDHRLQEIGYSALVSLFLVARDLVGEYELLIKHPDVESRVENRRSGFSLPVALTKLSRRRLSPVWRGSVSCSRSSNRTGGFPASGSRKRHTMIRVTPPATSEHNSGWLDSWSIPVSCVASCVRL